MRTSIEGKHRNDDNGNPAGGSTVGTGFTIVWQDGPLGRGESRLAPNGAFVENVIAAAIDRIEYYQQSRFECVENEMALRHLNSALACLNGRTREREERTVEGTHAE